MLMLESSEEYVLSAMLNDANAQTFIPKLNPNCFNGINRELFTIIHEMYINGEAIDFITIGRTFKDKAFLARVKMAYASSFHINTHVEVLRNAHTINFLKETTMNIWKKDLKLSTILSKLQDAIDNAGMVINKEPQYLPSAAAHLIDDIEEKLKKGQKTSGKPSGWRFIDYYLGGYNDGDLIIVAGRPGMGKTAFAFGLGLDFAMLGNSVLFFSLEMNSEQLAQRYFAYHEQAYQLRQNKVSMEDLERLSLWINKRNENFYIDDTGSITIQEIKHTAHLHRQKHGLDLIIIDYIGLIREQNKFRSRQEHIANVSNTLKQIAKDFKCTVVCLSQMNRESEQGNDHKPKMSHLRESGALEQDADCILFPFRPNYYSTDKPQVEDAEIIIAKNRHGGTATVPVQFVPHLMKYKEI
jgi:replicative DNA helicase